MKSRSISSDLRAFLSASNVLVSSTPALKDLSREECEAIARGITELSDVRRQWGKYLATRYTEPLFGAADSHCLYDWSRHDIQRR